MGFPKESICVIIQCPIKTTMLGHVTVSSVRDFDNMRHISSTMPVRRSCQNVKANYWDGFLLKLLSLHIFVSICVLIIEF